MCVAEVLDYLDDMFNHVWKFEIFGQKVWLMCATAICYNSGTNITISVLSLCEIMSHCPHVSGTVRHSCRRRSHIWARHCLLLPVLLSPNSPHVSVTYVSPLGSVTTTQTTGSLSIFDQPTCDVHTVSSLSFCLHTSSRLGCTFSNSGPARSWRVGSLYPGQTAVINSMKVGCSTMLNDEFAIHHCSTEFI